MKLYFAYGANLNLEGMRYRCPRAQQVGPFVLKDWRLSFSSVATIQPCPGSEVQGALWEITEECESSLDAFEGFPTLYRKHTVEIDGNEIMFYVMNNDRPREPGGGYLATIAEGYQDWNLDLEALWEAVKIVQEEEYWDRYSNTRASTKIDVRGIETMASNDNYIW